MVVGDGFQITLNGTAVVGGDYATGSVGNHSMRVQIAYPRPRAVSPPVGLEGEERLCWDGRAAADERRWYVRHEHNRTSTEIVEARRKKRAAT